MEEGIRVGGELIKDVKYADDQGMVANTKAGLQSFMDSLNTTAKHYDMKINIKKTKAMVVSRNGGEKMGEKDDEGITEYRCRLGGPKTDK